MGCKRIYYASTAMMDYKSSLFTSYLDDYKLFYNRTAVISILLGKERDMKCDFRYRVLLTWAFAYSLDLQLLCLVILYCINTVY